MNITGNTNTRSEDPYVIAEFCR